jgi:hypothetical protein
MAKFILGVVVVVWAAGPAFAHNDRPSDPPLRNEMEISKLVFNTDVDDGTNGLAELRVLYTVNWGGGHGISSWMWVKDHDFDTALPFSAIPPRRTIGAHTECTPAAAPVLQVKAYESDAGADPFVLLLIAVGGGAFGGALGSPAGPVAAATAAAGAALATGLATLAAGYFNGDDPLLLGTDFQTNGTFSQWPLRHGACTGTRASFEDTLEMYCSAAESSSADPEVSLRYIEYATHGVDFDFPFGRSASYASGRYNYLQEALNEADVLAVEPGGTADIPALQALIRNAATDFARIVAQATVDEAIAASVSAGVIAAAQNDLSAGDTEVSLGEYVSALGFYENVGQILLPVMFPDYVNPEDPCLANVPASSDVGRFILVSMIVLISASGWYLKVRLPRGSS